MDQTKTAYIERVQFAWAKKTAPRQQLKIQLANPDNEEDNSCKVKNRLKRFLIRLRTD
jgi:hypothetical protein